MKPKPIFSVRQSNGESLTIMSNTLYEFMGERMTFRLDNQIIVGENPSTPASRFEWTAEDFYAQTDGGQEVPTLCN